jgi:drug/metabolite transporter (DMT)-like permease
VKGRNLDIASFLAMATFWGLNYPVLKIALGIEGPFPILFYRLLIGAATSFLIFSTRIRMPRDLRTHLKIFTAGMLNVTLFMSFWFLGEQFEPASLSSILVYSFPIFAIVFSVLFLGDSLSFMKVVAAILGFVGVIMIFVQQVSVSSVLGVVLLLLSAIFWALGTVYYKKYLAGISPSTYNSLQLLYSTPIILTIAIFTDPVGLFHPSLELILLALILGFPGTSLAYLIFFHLYRKYNVSEISSYFFAVPAISLLLSYLILAEKSSFLAYIGFLLISGGIFFSYHDESAKKRKIDAVNSP